MPAITYGACCCGFSLPEECVAGGGNCPTCIDVSFAGVTCCDGLILRSNVGGPSACTFNLHCAQLLSSINTTHTLARLGSKSCGYRTHTDIFPDPLWTITDPTCSNNQQSFGRIIIQAYIAHIGGIPRLSWLGMYTHGGLSLGGYLFFYNAILVHSNPNDYPVLGTAVPNLFTECVDSFNNRQGHSGTGTAITSSECASCPPGLIAISFDGVGPCSGCTEIERTGFGDTSYQVDVLDGVNGTYEMGYQIGFTHAHHSDGHCHSPGMAQQTLYPFDYDWTLHSRTPLCDDPSPVRFTNITGDPLIDFCNGGDGANHFDFFVTMDINTNQILQISYSTHCGVYDGHAFFYAYNSFPGQPVGSKYYLGQNVPNGEPFGCGEGGDEVPFMIGSGGSAQVRMIDPDTGELYPCDAPVPADP